MSQKLRKLERIRKVQEQIHKAAELKLADLHRQADELQGMQQVLIETMNDHEVFHGLFVDTMAKRLQALAAQEVQVEAAKAVQRDIVFERAMQAKRTEKMVSDLAEENRRVDERKELLSIMETFPSKARASFP